MKAKESLHRRQQTPSPMLLSSCAASDRSPNVHIVEEARTAIHWVINGTQTKQTVHCLFEDYEYCDKTNLKTVWRYWLFIGLQYLLTVALTQEWHTTCTAEPSLYSKAGGASANFSFGQLVSLYLRHVDYTISFCRQAILSSAGSGLPGSAKTHDG